MPPRANNEALPFPLPVTPRPDLPVGGRLSHFLAAWSEVTDDAWVLSIIREGYRIPFLETPSLVTSPIPFVVSDSLHQSLIRKEIETLVEKQAVERVERIHSPGFYSRIFLVPKKNKSWRPVVDLSPLNKYIRLDKFRMETLSTIRGAVKVNDWAVSLDLSDAYLHVPIHPASRKFLRFAFEGKVYQFKALPFGISTAPRVFTILMRTVAAFLRSRGPSLVQYFDDWLLLQAKRQVLLSHLRMVWEQIVRLGLLPNKEKSELIPTQVFTYVGTTFFTSQGLIRTPPARTEGILSLVRSILARSHISARQYLSLLGTLGAAADLVPLGRLYLRPLQLELLAIWRPVRDALLTRVEITESMRFHLRWWLQESHFTIGVPLRTPEPDLFLYTDASSAGWGAHLEPQGLMTSGSWDEEHSPLHINNLELLTVRLSLQCFQEIVTGHVVMVATDNTTVVAYIRRQGGTQSYSLCQEAIRLLQWCHDQNVVLRVTHIPGRFNILADHLSRLDKPLATEWTLHQQVANELFSIFGFPNTDLFATRLNNRLPLYVSPVPDQAAWAVDAMSFSWDRLHAYAYPPSRLIQPVLLRFRSSCCQVLLIAPLWPDVLVPGSPPVVGGNAEESPGISNTSDSDQSPVPVRERTEATASRLAIIRSRVRQKKFSGKVASLIAEARRSSTRSVYQAMWSIFSDWCRGREIDPINPPVMDVANFLVFLFEVKNVPSALSMAIVRPFQIH